MSDTKTEMLSVADEDMHYLRDAHVAGDVKWLQQFRDELLLRQTVALERIADALAVRSVVGAGEDQLPSHPEAVHAEKWCLETAKMPRRKLGMRL